MATEDMVAMDMEEDAEMLMPNQKLKLMLIMAMGDMEDTEDMDMDVNAAMLMLNQKLMLTTDMVVTEVTVDMGTAASADLLLQKHLQLHIMDMVDTEDMDMDVNDDLLSHTMGMEDTEDTDMDDELIRSSFKGHQR